MKIRVACLLVYTTMRCQAAEPGVSPTLMHPASPRRDPFIQVGRRPETPTRTMGRVVSRRDGLKTRSGQPSRVICYAPPKLTVVGIVSSNSGRRAIVVGPTTTFLVQPGDHLGDYRVTSIASEVVTFAFKNYHFPIQLEQEFAPAGSPRLNRRDPDAAPL